MQIQRKQSGFTLVEIAIVLVIIGLLLGGVLKGQTMIENARVKSLTQEFTSIPTMLNAYQDKFRAVPGDDIAAPAHQPGALQATGNNTGNGRLDTGNWRGVAAIPTNANESALFWLHVRMAGLAPGPVTAIAGSGEARNAVDGFLGVTSTAAHPTTPAGITGPFTACSSGINGRLARSLDIATDDGASNAGALYATIQPGNPIVAATAVDAAYADASNYTVCRSF